MSENASALNRMDQNSLKQQLWMTAAVLNISKWF